jgi:hypothetical protein
MTDQQALNELKEYFAKIYSEPDKYQIDCLTYPVLKFLVTKQSWVPREKIIDYIKDHYQTHNQWGRGLLKFDNLFSHRFDKGDAQAFLNKFVEYENAKEGNLKIKINYKLKDTYRSDVENYMQENVVEDSQVKSLVDARLDYLQSTEDSENTEELTPKIWKISHGKNGTMSDKSHQFLIKNNLVAVGFSENDTQGKRFRSEIKEGDYFYLVRNSTIVLLGMFTTGKCKPAPEAAGQPGWTAREFKSIAQAQFSSSKVMGQDGWQPKGYTTVFEIPDNKLPEFEKSILKPAFNLTLSDLNDEINVSQNQSTSTAKIVISLNQIFYGPPGTGKTFNTVKAALQILENTTNPLGEFKEQKTRFDQFNSDGRIEFVTFHQSFSYEDFVEGIRAESNDGKLSYPIKNGVFKELVIKAETHPNQPYVLIIDEINRGNTSKIFGDLITLIEKTKRAGEDEAVKLTLPYSKTPFSVPNNLYILGTMNTADRSLALIDTALRRRFDFVEMMPNPQLIKVSDIDGVDVKKLLTTINERIEVLYDREHTIGHAFFMKLTAKSTIDDLENIFKNNMLPLLEEYFFEDWEKISQVLGKSGIYDEHKFSNLGPNFDSLGKSYRRVDEKLKEPSTYQAIYQSASVDE